MAAWVWPLNPKAMDDKTKPSSFYIARKDNNHLDENIKNSDDTVNDNPQSRERM